MMLGILLCVVFPEGSRKSGGGVEGSSSWKDNINQTALAGSNTFSLSPHQYYRQQEKQRTPSSR